MLDKGNLNSPQDVCSSERCNRVREKQTCNR